jgi:two-component system LytT family sensor kinase
LFHLFFLETTLLYEPERSYYTSDVGAYINVIIAYMKEILKLLKPYKVHFISWFVFISCEILIVGLASGAFGSPGIYFVHYLLNICLFYFCGHIIYPAVLKEKLDWIWKLPMSLSVIFLVYLLLNYLIDYQINKHTSWLMLNGKLFTKLYFFSDLWRALQFIGLAAFYYLFKQYQKTSLIKAQLEKDRVTSILLQKETEIRLAQANNAYLKAQINPHLLFNTLSFIYSDILETSPRAAEAVMTLSEIMRYSTNCEFNEDKILLGEEIEQVENLIKLHQTRFEDDLNIQFTFDPKIKSIRIIPLVLMTIVENLFKHGIYTDKEHTAIIDLKIEHDKLIMSSSNLMNRNDRKINFSKGLDNIRQRLALAYGNQAQLDFHTKNEHFYLSVEISSF